MKETQKKKKTDIKKIKNVVLIAAFILLALYYYYLRGQEQLTADQGTSAGNPAVLATAAPADSSAGQDQSIAYRLAGENGEKRYDSNGNLIDTSDFLVSVKNAAEVLPKGFSMSDISPYRGEPVVTVNRNVPYFTEAEIRLAEQGHFEYYGDLDSLGRCTVAFDCLGQETMPGSQKRGSISSIHPSGWKQAWYDCVDSETVMTRAHLAGYMLSTENANEKNLITGTRYMNSDSMLPYEESTQNYLYRNSGKHVLYRVTPCFRGNDLMAEGILMEALSVEDRGRSVRFCIYVYNVQPGIAFRYATGDSFYSGIFFDVESESVVTDELRMRTYGMVFSTNTIHTTDCPQYTSAEKTDRHTFYGDTAMQEKWSSFGYNICSCMK